MTKTKEEPKTETELTLEKLRRYDIFKYEELSVQEILVSHFYNHPEVNRWSKEELAHRMHTMRKRILPDSPDYLNDTEKELVTTFRKDNWNVCKRLYYQARGL